MELEISDAPPGTPDGMEQFEKKRDDAVGNWVEIRDNPSGDRFYKLRGTSLKIFDRKVLSYMTAENQKEIVSGIMRKHIHGAPYESIMFQERRWLVFWLRYHSFNNAAYVFDWQCPSEHCRHMNKKHAPLSEFKTKKPDPSLKPAGNVLELGSGKIAKFRMETIGLHDEMEEFVNGLQAESKAETIANFEMATVATLMEEFDGHRLKGLDNGAGMEFLNNMDPFDYDEIYEYVDKTLTGWGVSKNLEAECENCGRTTALAVNFRREFFVSKNRNADFD